MYLKMEFFLLFPTVLNCYEVYEMLMSPIPITIWQCWEYGSNIQGVSEYVFQTYKSSKSVKSCQSFSLFYTAEATFAIPGPVYWFVHVTV